MFSLIDTTHTFTKLRAHPFRLRPHQNEVTHTQNSFLLYILDMSLEWIPYSLQG